MMDMLSCLPKQTGSGKGDTFGRRKDLASIKSSENKKSNSSSKRQARLLRTMGLGYQKRLRRGCFSTAGPRNLATFGSSSWKALRGKDLLPPLKQSLMTSMT